MQLQLKKLCKESREGDSLIFYYSGHGTQGEGALRSTPSPPLLTVNGPDAKMRRLLEQRGPVASEHAYLHLCSDVMMAYNCLQGRPQYRFAVGSAQVNTSTARTFKACAETERLLSAILSNW